MLSGRHSVFFNLSFFSAVFLVDGHVRCASFLIGGLARAGGPCRAAAGARVVKHAGLGQLPDLGSHRLRDLLAVLPAAFVLHVECVTHGERPLHLLFRLYECNARS